MMGEHHTEAPATRAISHTPVPQATAGTRVGGVQPTVLGPSILANQLPGPPGYVVVPPASQIPVHPTKSVPKGKVKLGHSATTNQGNNNAMYVVECRIPGCGQPVFVDVDGLSE